jgi:DNA invertase Pin-like site-specific DNA recombinase
MEQLRLTGYKRVSSSGQVSDGLGLPVQDKRIRADAKAHGHRIVTVESDPGVSGTKDVADRPGILAVLQAVKDGRSDGLLITDLGRLSRLLTVQEGILAQVWNLGGRVFTVDQGEILPDDQDDPMRTACRQMMGVFFQLDRSILVRRLRNAREYKASQGGYAGGQQPYGMTSVDGDLVPDESEVAALVRMQELHDGGASLRQICAALTDEGFSPRRGVAWHANCVRRILAAQEPVNA